MKQFPKLNVVDRSLSLIQDNLSNALNPLLNLPLSTSNLLQAVSLVSGSNTVNHGLNRVLLGWIITRRNGTATVYDTQATNTTPALTLQLTSSGTLTVDLIVF